MKYSNANETMQPPSSQYTSTPTNIHPTSNFPKTFLPNNRSPKKYKQQPSAKQSCLRENQKLPITAISQPRGRRFIHPHRHSRCTGLFLSRRLAKLFCPPGQDTTHESSRTRGRRSLRSGKRVCPRYRTAERERDDATSDRPRRLILVSDGPGFLPLSLVRMAMSTGSICFS